MKKFILIAVLLLFTYPLFAANELHIQISDSADIFYCLITRVSDSTIWNGTTFVSFNTANYSTYVVAMTATNDFKHANFPTTIVAGLYSIGYYLYSSQATPQVGDLMWSSQDLRWSGTVVCSVDSAAIAGLPAANTTYLMAYTGVANGRMTFAKIQQLILAQSCGIMKDKVGSTTGWKTIYDANDGVTAVMDVNYSSIAPYRQFIQR